MTSALFPTVRLRRLRGHPVLRDLVSETRLHLKDLVCPIFIKGEEGQRVPVSTMPGQYQVPMSLLQEEVETLLNLGLKTFLLFGVPPMKDLHGSDSFQETGIIQRAIKKIREISSEVLIITDICLCEYTSHGHCGFIAEREGKYEVDNDETLEILAKQAISHAEAGADVVAPSGMIDGMVYAIRKALDSRGFSRIPILSYSVKYNSCLYGPFRAATEGAPAFGDRSCHQMDVANGKEALREVQLDIDEGADMLMVKPAHCYLDVIARIKDRYPELPLAAYHVSGEYAMIKAAAEKGWLNEKKTVMEVMKSLRRAGADILITYYAKQIAEWGLFD